MKMEELPDCRRTSGTDDRSWAEHLALLPSAECTFLLRGIMNT